MTPSYVCPHGCGKSWSDSSNQRASRPLDQKALAKAERAMYANCDRLSDPKRNLTVSDDDYPCRRVWMDAYLAAVENEEEKNTPVEERRPLKKKVDESVVQCPTSVGDLVVLVKWKPKGKPVKRAGVKIDGPEARRGTTDAGGWVEFTGLVPGSYVLAGEYEDVARGENMAQVDPDANNQGYVELHPTCDKSVPAAPRSIIGTCEYYTSRQENFLERHDGCAHKPPDYYVDYGYKYCEFFGRELYPKLTLEGKSWLGKARLLLQKYMERGLLDNPHVELDDDEFRSFAFNTHPDAYWDAGLKDLSVMDKVRIAKTPDLKEWKDLDTWDQAADVAWRQIKSWFD